MKTYCSIFEEIISTERLFEAWREFRKGKSDRYDVQEFERHLEKNLFKLQRDLTAQRYEHSSYKSFFIHDPKRRHIRKASVRDRIVHQALHSILSRIIEPKLIHDLYSSRIGKGTHAGVAAVSAMSLKVSKNLTRPCWFLKCDIRRFYDSVDHTILLQQLESIISDKAAMKLVREVIHSFYTEGMSGKGLPIGNLTSQVFTNVYLNELDQFIKHKLKHKFYARFADDFVLLSEKKGILIEALPLIQEFLCNRLRLDLHPQKVIIRSFEQGVDFLGYVILPHHRVLRTSTKRRMYRKLTDKQAQVFRGSISCESMNQSIQSYLGMMSHANTHRLQIDTKNRFCWE